MTSGALKNRSDRPMFPFILFPRLGDDSEMKVAFRDKLRVERAAAKEGRPDAPAHAARHFMTHIPHAENAVVALYHPLKDELDTAPLAQALHDAGVRLALPVVERKNAPLIFRRYAPGDALVEGAFGVMTPNEDAEPLTPDIIVTPLLGFTATGGRLGYGGGFYDRTLEDLRNAESIIAIGYAYGAQEIKNLPIGSHDQFLDWIVTERGATKTNPPASRPAPKGPIAGLLRWLGL